MGFAVRVRVRVRVGVAVRVRVAVRVAIGVRVRRAPPRHYVTWLSPLTYRHDGAHLLTCAQEDGRLAPGGVITTEHSGRLGPGPGIERTLGLGLDGRLARSDEGLGLGLD